MKITIKQLQKIINEEVKEAQVFHHYGPEHAHHLTKRFKDDVLSLFKKYRDKGFFDDIGLSDEYEQMTDLFIEIPEFLDLVLKTSYKEPDYFNGEKQLERGRQGLPERGEEDE